MSVNFYIRIQEKTRRRHCVPEKGTRKRYITGNNILEGKIFVGLMAAIV
jgi:hypothetical protein